MPGASTWWSQNLAQNPLLPPAPDSASCCLSCWKSKHSLSRVRVPLHATGLPHNLGHPRRLMLLRRRVQRCRRDRLAPVIELVIEQRCFLISRDQRPSTPKPVCKDRLTDWLTDWLTDSLANICHHISKNIESKFWNIYLQLLLVNFFYFGTSAFRLNISIYIKNTYNRPRVCFCDLHKI